MNKGKINNHTRNQKRMYRIHKQEELIEKQRYIIGDLQQRIDKAVEYIKENQDMVEWIHIPGWDLLNILQNGSENNE